MQQTTSEATQPLRFGVIGFGGFGLFATQHMVQIPGVQLMGMAGTHREAAYAAAQRYGIPEPTTEEELVARDDVDAVYIATPPFLHYDNAMMALRAGKHVICEKPMAVTVEQANEMLALAEEKNLLCVTNLMQRYATVNAKIKELCDQRLLGEPLHGFFENYANDEGLGPNHWFWDRQKSGGIFIEHGVHFFDLFAWWLGEGKVVCGQRTRRPGSGLEEQVNCTALYDDVTVNFYHGFTQPSRMDRQATRILFERGDITLYEWLPTRAHIHTLADEATTKKLMELFEGARLRVTELYGGEGRGAKGRHKQMDVHQMIEIDYGLGDEKLHAYGDALQNLLTDQMEFLRNPSHQRRITNANGRDSLIMAVDATRFADEQESTQKG